MDPLELDQLTAPIRLELDAKFAAREIGYVKSREVIRASANAIRSLHRGQWETADELVDTAGSTLREVQAVLGDHPDILHGGFVHDAAKEYAEAAVCTALFRGRPLPTPALLEIHPVAYLHGLGEAVGSCAGECSTGFGMATWPPPSSAWWRWIRSSTCSPTSTTPMA